MALVELQIRRQAFLDFFKNEINRQRLPSRTIEALPDLSGKLLQRIECTAASVEPSAGAGQIVVREDLIFHHNTLAAVRAAGSLQAPVTEQVRKTIPVTIAIVFDQPGVPRIRWSIFGGVVPGKDIPVDLAGEVKAQTGAVEADENVVAFRFGTNAADMVTAPIVNRLGTDDWVQLVSGQVIADMFLEQFAPAVQNAVSDTLHMGTPPSAAWFPAFGNFGPSAGCSATLVAVNACLGFDVPVDLQLIGTLQPTGPSLLTTARFSWDPDSTACEFFGGLLFTPIASVAIHGIAEDAATEQVLGKVKPSEGFKEIARDDESITYQRQGALSTASPRFVLTHSEVTDEGLVTRGTLSPFAAARNLKGYVTVPSSGLTTDCPRRTVYVEFQSATVGLTDVGVEGGAPRLLPDGIAFDPPNAWGVVPGPSNTWLDLELAFVDPPTGRLPVGTATSVFLHTDCGLRWADLGVIPADHPPPTTADMVEMVNRCITLRDPWGLGVLNLHWLVDPPDFRGVLAPVRQWIFAAMDLPVEGRLDFVAISRDGTERRLGGVEGRREVALHIVTDASETLQVRTPRGFSAPAPRVWQRWVVPLASMPLENGAVSLASDGEVIGVREPGGITRIVEMGEDGELRARRLEGAAMGDPGLSGVLKALDRGEQRSGSQWTVPARIDRQTVALTHHGQLLIGRALPSVRL